MIVTANHALTSDSRDQLYRNRLRSYMTANDERPSYHQHLNRLLSEAPLTDAGNALRLYARYGMNLRYVSTWGAWIYWNGQYWQRDEYGLVQLSAKRTIGWIAEESASVRPGRLTEAQSRALNDQELEGREIHEKIADSLLKWCYRSQSKGRLEAAVELLKSEPGMTVTIDDLDRDDHLLNFLNGTLNLRTMQFHKHQKTDLITKIVQCAYDPNASAPRFTRFVEKLTSARPAGQLEYQPRPELARYLRAVSGTCLYGAILDDALYIFHGSGGNGKTVFAEILKEVMGGYAMTATADLFVEKQSEGISNDKARLAGSRGVFCSETDEGKMLAESLVKGLTGGDKATARFLRQEFFEFFPKFTAILLTNYPPVVRGGGKGIWRRLKLIPFEFDFTVDSERADKITVMQSLREEASGIMNWLLAGLADRLAIGKMEDLEPAVVVEATKRYKEDSDIIGQYIGEDLWPDPLETIDKDIVYQRYVTFVKDGGMYPVGKRKLSTVLMTQKGWLDRRSTNGKRVWIGWRLRNDSDIEPEETQPDAGGTRENEGDGWTTI